MTKQMKDEKPFGSSAFIVVFLAILFVFVFTVGQNSKDKSDKITESVATEVSKDGKLADSDFWKIVTDHQPIFENKEYACLVDGLPFQLPMCPRGSDNRAGGVATDMMKIAIRPDKESKIKPNFDLQEFEQKMGTCSGCGATYMDIDYANIQAKVENGVQNLSAWDLSAILPTLDPKECDSWTSDIRSFVRYNVQKQAGYPHNELGFGALAGAYCSNFSSWYGKEFTIPSPAFYALAAAHIRVDLERDLPENIAGRVTSAVVLGELYRLLGRSEDTAHWFEYARSLGTIDPNLLRVLEFSESHLSNGDFSLKRIPNIDGQDAPPIGWQIDLMLPNINGHISEHRNDWAGLDEIDEIEAKIVDVISAKVEH